jgi:hypothetical protein
VSSVNLQWFFPALLVQAPPSILPSAMRRTPPAAARRHPSATACQRRHRHHRRWRVQRRRNLIKKGAHVKLSAKPPCRTWLEAGAAATIN